MKEIANDPILYEEHRTKAYNFAKQQCDSKVVFDEFARPNAEVKVVKIEVLLTTISVFTLRVPKIRVPSLSSAIYLSNIFYYLLEKI